MRSLSWRESLAAALTRLAARRSSGIVTRQELIDDELPRIVRETGSRGATPEQTLSRVLQDLRDDRQIEFVGPGEYRLIGRSVH